MTPEERVLLFDTDQYIYPDYGVTPVKITERGWGGHYCLSSRCRFRRNTLLEYHDKRWIVSTVGNMRDANDNLQTVGLDHYYETMAFVASKQGPYWDIDVCQELYVQSACKMSNVINDDVDNVANDMHNAVVVELAAVIQTDDVPLTE